MKFKTVVRLMLGIVMGICASGIGAVSIQNLIDQHKMPKIRGIGVTLLDLSGLGITDLTGLGNIPGIEKVKVLRLANNDIKKIPAEAFKAAKELRALGLSGNGLELIEPGAFKGLGKLRVLVFNSNKINDIPKKGLSGLRRNLWLLALGSNPITADKIKDVKKQVRRAYVMTLPVTAANLKKVGAVAVGLAMLALATVGVVYTVKELSKEEKPLSEVDREKLISQLTPGEGIEFETIVSSDDKDHYLRMNTEERPVFMGLVRGIDYATKVRPVDSDKLREAIQEKNRFLQTPKGKRKHFSRMIYIPAVQTKSTTEGKETAYGVWMGKATKARDEIQVALQEAKTTKNYDAVKQLFVTNDSLISEPIVRLSFYKDIDADLVQMELQNLKKEYLSLMRSSGSR